MGGDPDARADQTGDEAAQALGHHAPVDGMRGRTAFLRGNSKRKFEFGAKI